MENISLLTDYYELTMLQGYFKNNIKDRIVVFDMFFRNNPWKNGYSIMAGIEQLIEYIENLHFSHEDIEYLRSLNSFEDDFLLYLENFKFEGDIYAIEEGRLIFPQEPIVKIVAPLMQAQLIESTLLNIINHQCLIATKAARIVQAAKGDKILEFGLRRAQGSSAAILGARAAIIGGLNATSNVLTGKLFNIPVSGTHAHSWIMNFNSELDAFRAYAKLYSDNLILLVDTYNTVNSGIPNAIKVFQELRDEGIELKTYGIRLDSGDLAYLSKKARRMLDDAGFNDAIISASNDLDEYLIESLKNQGAKVSLWGVGTNLITADKNSSFGGVYKMSAVLDENNSFIPKIKLSDNISKITYPGNKKIYRIYEKPHNKIRADFICLNDEVIDENKDLTLFDPIEPWKRTIMKAGTYYIDELLTPIFKDGKLVYKSPSVMEIRDRCSKEKELLWDESKRLINPHKMYVDISDSLYELQQRLFKEKKFI